MMSPPLKVGLLCAFWVLYGGLPVYFGLFDLNHVGSYPYWDDVFRHGFALFGYGTIGATFYAMAGQTWEAGILVSRWCVAMFINAFGFLLMLGMCC